MKPTVRRALAATTICAAVAATLTAGPVASAQQGRAERPGKITGYGYKGTAVGARLITGNVENLSLREAEAPLRCTRKVDRVVDASGKLTAPENSLISLSESTSRTLSYAKNGRYGVRAVNTLGDITLGGTLPGQDESTPIVTLKGLQTTADAFHTAQGYGHKESFTAPTLAIDVSVLTDNGVPIPPELTDLLDTLEQTGNQLTGQVIDVLQQAGAPIEIPQLGSIAMGYMKGHAGKYGAESDTKALQFVIDATGEEQSLQLGQARAVIGGPTPAGVFRSTSMPLEVSALDGVLHFGAVKPKTIPCAGTRGRTAHRHLDSASVAPGGLLIGATDIDYTFMGRQRPDGSARGLEVQRIGEISIPSLQLTLNDIVARSTARMNRKGDITNGHSGSVGSITYQGETVAAPGPGKTVNLGDIGYLEGLSFEKSSNTVTALRLTLVDENLVIDLAKAQSRIFAY
ncbi:hypothetical protein H5V45_17810 [Nocardioides sp. KIGAM211]|uniref:Uncharacterized protein n=1 Tax=Nocardioides luti TaxID=2761101 RepID=A0A7X0VDD5_9ACTN|nr:hypothetical protein [Nocardioides luti]MBB6629188.1 hypothetical protein [Nocardioides luti]